MFFPWELGEITEMCRIITKLVGQVRWLCPLLRHLYRNGKTELWFKHHKSKLVSDGKFSVNTVLKVLGGFYRQSCFACAFSQCTYNLCIPNSIVQHSDFNTGKIPCGCFWLVFPCNVLPARKSILKAVQFLLFHRCACCNARF